MSVGGGAKSAYALDVSGNANISGDISCNGKIHGDGSLLTGISSGGSGVGMFKNGVINGDMRINQRKTSSTGWSTGSTPASTGSAEATTTYVADRFSVYRDGFVTGALCACRVITTVPNTNVQFTDSGIVNYSQVGRKSGDTGTANINMRYAFEMADSYKYYGKTVTLSFYYSTGANFSGSSLNCAILLGFNPGLQRGASAYTTLSTTVAASSSYIRASFTTTIPTMTANIYYMGLSFSYTPSGTAGTNDWFSITGVQLEKGSSATEFEYRPYVIEYQLCRRYCVYCKPGTWLVGIQYLGGLNAQINVQLQTPMRIMPTISKQDAIGTYTLCFSNNTNYNNDDLMIFDESSEYLTQLTLCVPNAAMVSESGIVSLFILTGLGISAEM